MTTSIKRYFGLTARATLFVFMAPQEQGKREHSPHMSNNQLQKTNQY